MNHLPLTCEFQIIEVRIHPPLISPATMQFFTGKYQFSDTKHCIFFFSSDEIHRRRQYRTRKERLENRRQQRAEYAETQKLFSQCNFKYIENGIL